MRHPTTRPVAALTALAAALVLVAPATAHATAPVIATEGAAHAVGATESEADARQRAELLALAETQSRDEAQAIAEAGHAEALVDVDSWEVIAARRVDPIDRMRVSHLAPGCSTTSACVHANNGTTKLGYTGTGVLATTMRTVTKFDAGNATTTLWAGANFTSTAPYTTKVLTRATTFDSIVRS